ncbi:MULTISPECIES: MBL fold metallo-hydrolase [unclassified Streptomyces]|uniref:MBL fold metallo-hydrolase n=1 Tax=unclassified Streptomyces TaxID=2593676 RepID=UPI0004BD3FFE|nr:MULTISPECIES: MBL fold metallo-hydrolase [unclassified Streptomyces]
MKITKFGHASVTIEDGDRRLVIDPGGLTDPSVLDGVTDVLVTHEHFDHFSEATLRKAAAEHELRVWTNTAVASKLDGFAGQVRAVGEGSVFTAQGFEIQVHGTWHAEIHPDIPRVANIGFLIDGTVFHPGDALTVPDTPVDTLLLPVHGPWSTTGQLVDYVREVAPARVRAIHDGALNEVGRAMVGGLLGDGGPGIGSHFQHFGVGETESL